MVPTSFVRRLLIVGLVVASTGCLKQDGGEIFGRWNAERFNLMSLKVPIGPELRITKDSLAVGDEAKVPIVAMTQDGDEVTLDLSMNLELTFHFVDKDRMYVDLPFVDRIYYRRVLDAEPTKVEPALAAVPGAKTPGPAPAPAPAKIEPAREAPPRQVDTATRAYETSVAAAKRGDTDAAVRSLYQALEAGFPDIERVRTAPEFEPLRSDVRYQVLVSRYGGR